MASSSLFGLFSAVVLLFLVRLCRVSSQRNHCSLNGFNVDVDAFGKHVQHCPYNCSSVPVDDFSCTCVNLSVAYDFTCKCVNHNTSGYRCDFPEYFIKALMSLHPSSHNSLNTWSKRLCKDFRLLNQTCNIWDFCPFNMTYDRVLSPRLLSEKLTQLKQQLNAKAANLLTAQKQIKP